MRRLNLDLADAVLDIPFDMGLGRRPSRAVERDRQRATTRVQHKTIAADAGALRLDDALHGDRSDRGIGGVAARAQHVERGQCRHRSRGRGHPVRRHRRRASRNIEVAHRLSLPRVQIARRRSNPDRRAHRLLGTNAPSYPAGQFVNREENRSWTEVSPRCTFRLRTRPPPGETVPIAPGVLWLRMPLPFALDHINLWLLEDGAGWTIVDAGYALPETTALWERIFAEWLGGRPVTRVIVTHYHPDHIGLAGWLCERWQARLWTTEKEWLHARVMSRETDDFASSRREFARRAGLDAASSETFRRARKGLSPRRALGPGLVSTARRWNECGDRRAANGG